MSGAREDDGYTLVELLVYIAVLVLVTGVVASFAVVAHTTNARVQSASTSSNTAQVAADAINAAVRQAKVIAAPTSSRPSLVLDDGVSATRCRAFFVGPVAGRLVGRPDAAQVSVLRTRSAASAPGLPADSTSALDSGWTLLAVGVSPLTTSGGLPSAAPAGAALQPVLASSGRSVTLSFSIDATSGAAAQAIQATYSSRQPTIGTSTPCV